MLHNRLLLVVATMTTTAACGPSAAGVPDEQRAPASVAAPVLVTRLRAEPYSFTSTSALRTAQRTVISDDTSWRAAWTMLWENAASAPPLPAVDFAREMIVLAALGERPTGGYQILLDSAVTTGEKSVVIHVRTVSPGARCGLYQALTQPVDIARLPRLQRAITFRDHAVVAECP